MRVLAATDKLKGTLSAADACAAVGRAARAHGCDVVELPLADGGEGTLDALGGANRRSRVTGPLGEPVVGAWRLDDGEAVVEMAQAAGLVLAGGREGNDPWGATTRGVGELVLLALDEGARSVVVSVGGSASTDGGRGAYEVLAPHRQRLAGVELVVAADVTTPYLDAARVFAPQKGADAALVERLTERLQDTAAQLQADTGVDVRALPGSGAAGGLAGGLAALGARIVPGFDLVAGRLGLAAQVAAADLVVTGEGRLDASSLAGKVVGGVLGLAGGTPVAVVCGTRDDVRVDAEIRCLAEAYGERASLHDTAACIEAAVSQLLSDRGQSRSTT
ncbi:glycerate kinase [Motilibacter peucedani]|uniref:Glycerate kinase n=1 Tax=Motilibacter peucedani TaxID=598650 RepID=A0A420XKI9_9ACTN|nr:glycerate kinase [Motilibacter peucedani]RKS68543.1 glycerate kinase [Motilibacter peucedani]